MIGEVYNRSIQQLLIIKKMIYKILKKIKTLWNLNNRKNETIKLSLKTISDSNSRKIVSILKEIINDSNWDKDEVKQFEKINLIRNGAN